MILNLLPSLFTFENSTEPIKFRLIQALFKYSSKPYSLQNVESFVLERHNRCLMFWAEILYLGTCCYLSWKNTSVAMLNANNEHIYSIRVYFVKRKYTDPLQRKQVFSLKYRCYTDDHGLFPLSILIWLNVLTNVELILHKGKSFIVLEIWMCILLICPCCIQVKNRVK